MEKMLLFTIFVCLVAFGHSLPYNWRYSNPSYRSYSRTRWGYNPYRHYNGHQSGYYTPYSYHHKMHTKGVEKESKAVEPGMNIDYLNKYHMYISIHINY